VALLTTLLAVMAGPRGPLLVGYPLLVAASGRFFRVRLVAVTTCAAALACGALWLLRPDDAPPLHYCGVFLASLAIVGFVIGYQVRRVRVLSQYYEHRELP
jgi:eukaryotic-like serine/threonine-protein kinase